MMTVVISALNLDEVNLLVETLQRISETKIENPKRNRLATVLVEQASDAFYLAGLKQQQRKIH